MWHDILWSLIPDSALPLLLVAAGLLLILGFRHAAIGLIGMILLSTLLAPFIGALLGALPLWLVTILLMSFGLSILRGVIALLLGSRATDHLVGALAADVVRLTLRLIFLPFRLFFSLLRRHEPGQDDASRRESVFRQHPAEHRTRR